VQFDYSSLFSDAEDKKVGNPGGNVKILKESIKPRVP
jgi:hypothetical protein